MLNWVWNGISCFGKRGWEEEEVDYYSTSNILPSYEVQLRDEADCEEAVWCKLVAGHKNSSHGTSLPLSKHNKREQ